MEIEENKTPESTKSINSSFMTSNSPTFNLQENNINLNIVPMTIEEPNNKKIDPYNKNVDIVRLNNENILEGVKGSDYIFHIGGMVSPQCDTKPYLTFTQKAI